MRYKMMISVIAFALIASTTFTLAQNEEEMTRGGFITSRPATASAGVGGSVGGSVGVSTGGSSAPRRKPRRRPAAAKTYSNTNKSTTASGKTNVTANANTSVKAYTPKPLGMGYTLFMRDFGGEAVRVDPTRTFKTGERVRIALETNENGYLYIFNTTDNGDPVMIYPDPRLDQGGNYIEAHVPVEVPSGEEADENYRWFTFDNKPGVERLYIVFTREPLPVVPIEDDLVNYCKQGAQNCPWRPVPAVWAQVQTAMQARVQVAKSKTYGQKQTATERDATTRGVGLAKGAPEPSIIRMNASSDTGILITVLELSHS